MSSGRLPVLEAQAKALSIPGSIPIYLPLSGKYLISLLALYGTITL